MLKVFINSGAHSFQVDCERHGPISLLKAKIEAETRIKAYEQFLTYKYKPLKDTKTLESYEIKDQETVDLNIRVRGGGKKKIKDNKLIKKIAKKINAPYFDNFRVVKEELLLKGYDSIEKITNMYNKLKEAKHDGQQLVWYWKIGQGGIVVISRDNRYVISGDADKSIMVFDMETKDKVRHFENTHIVAEITCLVLSNDGRFVISGSEDKSIKVFDLEKGVQVSSIENVHAGCVLVKHTCLHLVEGITSLTVMSNDVFVISGSKDRSLHIVNLEKKKVEFKFENLHRDWITSVAVTKDDKYIISASKDSSIKILDFEMKTEARSFEGIHGGPITKIIVMNDNKHIISASHDKCIKILNLETKAELYNFKDIHKEPIISMAISHDNKYLISASLNKDTKVFDVSTKAQIHSFKESFKGKFNNPRSIIFALEDVFSIDLSRDNRYIVIGCADKMIRVFDLEFRSEEYHFKEAHEETITSICVSRNSRYIVSGSMDKSIKVFDIEDREETLHLESAHETGEIKCVAISKDSKKIFSGSANNCIKVHDISNGMEIHNFKGFHKGCLRFFLFAQIFSTDSVTSVVVSNDNKYLISGSEDKSIKVLDLENKTKAFKVKKTHTESICSVAISKNNKYLVSGSHDLSIQVFNVETQVKLFGLENAHEDAIHSIAITNDSKQIISGSADKSIKIFDIDTQSQVHHFIDAHQDQITSVAVTHDDKYIVSASHDRSIKIFDMWTKVQVHVFKDIHTKGVTSLALTVDNQYIVSASEDKSIKILLLPFNKKNSNYDKFFVSSKISPFTAFRKFDDVVFNNLKNSSLCKSYQDMYIVPYYWTILHLQAILNPSDIPLIADYKDFKVPFLVDKDRRTPLHYILAHDNIDYNAANVMFKYIIDYLESKGKRTPFEYRTICESLSNILLFIIIKFNPKYVKQYLKLCLVPTASAYNVLLPKFGSSKNRAKFTLSPIINNHVQELIASSDGDDQIAFQTVLIHFDYDLLSEDMWKAVVHFANIKDQEFFQLPCISIIINYLWKKTYFYMQALMLVQSAIVLLPSIYISTNKQTHLETPFIVITSLFMASELIKIVVTRSKYFKNVWNWMHFSQLICSLIYCTSTDDRHLDISEELLALWIIIVAFLKWIIYLRIFNPIRRTIHVINYIIGDLLAFLSIQCLIVIGGFLVFFEVHKHQRLANQSYSTDQFNDLNDIYFFLLLSFKDYPTSIFDEKVIKSIALVFSFFVLTTVLSNIMIAIMVGSYEKMQEKKILIDSVTRLTMIREILILTKFFRRKKVQEKGYLMYCGSMKAEDNDSLDSGWDNRMKVLKEMTQQTVDKMEKENSVFRAEVNKVQKEVIQLKQELKNEMGSVKQDINKLRKGMEYLEEGLKKEIKAESKRTKDEYMRIVKAMNADIARNHQQIMDAILKLSTGK